MNKQRNVLITITYNEMGIIIDTKTEEVAQPNLQPTCNQLATDCISRQDAIDTLLAGKEFLMRALDDTDVVCQDREKYSWGLGLIESCINDIEELSSAEPRKKGKWIRSFDGNEWYWYCSKCKEEWYEEDLWMGGNDFPNFCPNCGADMRGRKEE